MGARTAAPWSATGRQLTGLAAFLVLFLVGNDVLPDLTFGHGWPTLVEGPLATLIATLGSYWVVMAFLEHRPVPHDLDPPRVGGFAWGCLLGALMCCVTFALCWAGGWRRVVGHRPHEPLLVPMFGFGLCVGIAEEIVFRGVVFRALESLLGTWGATALSGVGFGLMHLQNPNATLWGAVAIALEAGVGLALLYRLTDSLWWTIGVHAAWNVVQGPFLGSAISGSTTNGDGLLSSLPVGPVWLSGGEFGLEATPAAVLVWGLLSVWFARQLVVRGLVVRPAAARRWSRRRA